MSASRTALSSRTRRAFESTLSYLVGREIRDSQLFEAAQQPCAETAIAFHDTSGYAGFLLGSDYAVGQFICVEDGLATGGASHQVKTSGLQSLLIHVGHLLCSA